MRSAFSTTAQSAHVVQPWGYVHQSSYSQPVSSIDSVSFSFSSKDSLASNFSLALFSWNVMPSGMIIPTGYSLT